VPLLGLADTAVIGRFASLEDLGAVAFGAVIFSFVYWASAFCAWALLVLPPRPPALNSH
jgi:Na+-driven multidrug efflux pump